MCALTILDIQYMATLRTNGYACVPSASLGEYLNSYNLWQFRQSNQVVRLFAGMQGYSVGGSYNHSRTL
jgi:hypothetical protein